MVIVESALSHRVFAAPAAGHHVDVDELTLGLGKAGAMVTFAYFFLKLQGVVDGHAWGHLATGWGALFRVEMVGFVLVPSLLFAYGRPRRQGAAGPDRGGADGGRDRPQPAQRLGHRPQLADPDPLRPELDGGGDLADAGDHRASCSSAGSSTGCPSSETRPSPPGRA